MDVQQGLGRKFFDWKVEGLVRKATSSIRPIKASKKDFRQSLEAFRQSQAPVFYVYYDTTDAGKDPNCIFPLTRLHDLAAEGVIGGVAPLHIGMMGFVPAIEKVLEETGPEVARRLVASGADAVLLTPG